MSLLKHLRKALTEEYSLKKAEDPVAYAKTASTGFILAHPVKINGESHRKDNGIDYHSTVKFFDKEKDNHDDAHKTASQLDLTPPDPKETHIGTNVIKDRMGNDVYAITLHGKHADKLKENHKKFDHMGHKENYDWNAHISVPKAVHDEIKASGHKTAHEAGIEFGPAQLKRGKEVIHTYKLKEPMKKSEGDAPSTVKPPVKINPEHGKAIADAYEGMKHEPNSPHVKAAYDALTNETGKQFKDIMGSGLKISQIKPGQANPYKSSKEMHNDIKNNKHLWYFPTEQGFGSGGQASDHPMLGPSGFKHDGKSLVHNDIFRIVHDINGHHAGGETGFGPTGEHQAYLTHKKMYSPLAGKALATETMGQNNWVNFGPHGENNRKNPAQTKFADQKAGLLPEHITNGDWHNAS